MTIPWSPITICGIIQMLLAIGRQKAISKSPQWKVNVSKFRNCSLFHQYMLSQKPDLNGLWKAHQQGINQYGMILKYVCQLHRRLKASLPPPMMILSGFVSSTDDDSWQSLYPRRWYPSLTATGESFSNTKSLKKPQTQSCLWCKMSLWLFLALDGIWVLWKKNKALVSRWGNE